MTETGPTPQQKNPAPTLQWRRRFTRLVATFLLALLLSCAFGYWLIASQSGANFSLSLLSSATGMRFQGVSGSLHHQLHIQHIEMQNKEMEFSADGLELQWQPSALLKHQMQLDYLRINNLELALAKGDGQPVGMPKSLLLPLRLKQFNADRLEVSQFELSELSAGRRHEHSQHFSALTAKVAANTTVYALQFAGTTPWGSAQIDGDLASTAPFNMHAQINWVGLAIRENDMTLPSTTLKGTLSGNLSRIEAAAQIDSVVAPTDLSSKPAMRPKATDGQTKGSVQLVLTPFAPLPVDTMLLDLVAVNPASIYKDAPKANLRIKTEFKVSGDPESPTLRGQVVASNDSPATWNSGGIPVVQVKSEMTLSLHKISWSNARINLEQDGFATGEGELTWTAANTVPATAAEHEIQLPMLSTRFELGNVNLLRLDSRLKKTRLSGKIQVLNRDQNLNFGLHLQESDPKLQARVDAELSLTRQLKLNLQKLELTSKDAILTAAGFIALHENHAFAIKGEAHNFNPSRWIDVPDGHIATRFQLTGQLQSGWQVDAQIAELSGQFAGLDLHGESDFHAQQNQLLMVKKLDLNWGKNHLSASGNWQLGNQANATQHEQLQFALAVPDLAGLSRPFEKIIPVSLQGTLSIDGALTGTAAQPGGHLNIKANQLAIPRVLYLDGLHAEIALEEGAKGKVDGNLTVTGIATSALNSKDDDRFKIERLQATLSGLRHAHNLQIDASLPQQQQVLLRADGDLQEADATSGIELRWVGKVLALNLSGPLDFQLQAPFEFNLSGNAALMGDANWQGRLGRLHIQQLAWQHGQIKTNGQFQDVPVVRVLKLWRNDLPVTGKLMLDAAWQFDVGQQMAGQLKIQRTSGDLAIQDTANGHTQSIDLGLKTLAFQLGVADAGSQSSRQPVSLSLQVLGDQLGLINISAASDLSRTDQGWSLEHNAPLSGQASLQIKNIGWMSQLLGPGINLHGELNAQAQLNGALDSPLYHATINGQDLQVAFPDLGVLLPNGKLDASIDGSQFTLHSLRFSQAIKKPPRHEFLTDLPWLNETGFVESKGTVDLRTLQGTINTEWEKFPFLQNPEAWMVASGQAQLAESDKSWNVTGKLVTDAAYFSVPKQAAPRLSGDVVVLKKNAKRSSEKTQGLQTSLDFSVSTGKNFVFVGRGIDTRLDGDIRLRSKNGGTLIATGSIQTMGGNYEGYGQQLAIDRGILNFQGPIDNPGLNVRAIRRGLPVEAGVEVVGTVAKPEVHLISEPNVPDPDKLSWMVLGRPSDQMAGSEATVLMSAAGAIFGGDNGSNIPSSIAHTLGLEDLSFGTTSTAPDSQLPTQTVAGTINSTAPTDQVFSVGKRIAPDLVFSIERSLTDASNGLKLTWQLTRRFSIIGRAGSDTAIDGQYTFSFD